MAPLQFWALVLMLSIAGWAIYRDRYHWGLPEAETDCEQTVPFATRTVMPDPHPYWPAQRPVAAVPAQPAPERPYDWATDEGALLPTAGVPAAVASKDELLHRQDGSAAS